MALNRHVPTDWDKMGISVGTIFKWTEPYYKDFPDEPGEACDDGQCVGIVQKVIDPDETSVSGGPTVMVKFWEKCAHHAQVDPNGEGPYPLGYIWQIGQM